VISEKVTWNGRARCPTYGKSMAYIPVSRAPSPAKRTVLSLVTDTLSVTTKRQTLVRHIMPTILSGTKFVRLNFIPLFCICLSLLPLGVAAQVIDFSHKTIKEPINIEFWKGHIQKGIEIDSSYGIFHLLFHRPIDFTETEFTHTADFRLASFDSSVIFYLATFDSSVSFYNAQFHSTADFGGTKFKAMADFWWATFDSSVSFSHAVFDSTANFVVTKFKGRVDFEWTRFREDVIFSNAILPDTLDFRYVKDISKEIDFTFSLPPRPKENCHIALAGADISKIKLNMALFTLWFPIDTTFGKSSAGKDSIIGIHSTSYDGQLNVYESVLKKLKDNGFMESYQILDIEYRRLKYEHGGFLNRYMANTFQQWWWNYGYSKELVFVWAIGFWGLFSLLNLIFFYPKLSERVYEIKFLERMQESGYTGIKKWIFYALQVVSYTAIVFFGLKMDVAKFKKGVVREHPWLFVYLMVVYVVGLVCLGFIVNIIFTR
jgi:hypothetical protein